MTRRALCRAALLSVLIPALFSPCPAAGGQDAERLLARVQAWLDGTRHLEARFEQTLLSGALGAGLSESGRLYLERPGRMRWEYLDPERKTALLDGEEMRLYLAEDEQLIRSRIPEDGDLLPTLLAGDGRLTELFEAEALEGPETEDGAPRLRLLPRGRTESFEEVILSLRPPEFAIERALVLDAAGNKIEYRFSVLRRNRGLPEGVFAFEPPPGTEIISQ